MNDIVRFSAVFPFVAGTFLLNIESNIIAQLGIGAIQALPGVTTLSLISSIIISYAIFQFKTAFTVLSIGICVLMNAPLINGNEQKALGQEFWATILLIIILLPNVRQRL